MLLVRTSFYVASTCQPFLRILTIRTDYHRKYFGHHLKGYCILRDEILKAVQRHRITTLIVGQRLHQLQHNLSTEVSNSAALFC